jgi:hypothetical protein
MRVWHPRFTSNTIITQPAKHREHSMNACVVCRAILLPCIYVAMTICTVAQSANVRLDKAGTNPQEVSIAINPLNPDNIIAGSNLRFYYYSFDGGKTWTQESLPSGTWGDPCVIFDKTGRAYIANLRYGWDAIVVRYSDDGGMTWSEGVKLYGPSSPNARPGSYYNSSLQDKEWLATDMSDGPFGGAIYAAWTDFTKYGSHDPGDSTVIVFARSLDRGESFEPFVRVSDRAGNALDGDSTVEGAVPAVGPDGTVYLCWAGPEGLYFDRSFDGGVTWGEDRVISDMPGGWALDISGIMRANGLPVTVTDISHTATRGNIYINWVDVRYGDPDVFILVSTDRGDTWRGPVRVNDDEPGNGKDQFFTWATVDPVTGELLVVFYDRRRYESDSTDVWLARSSDGGMTFTNELISTAAFYPSPMVFFGDYNGIAAYNGRVRPIWTEMDQGRLSIHACLIDRSPSSMEPLPTSMNGVRLRHYPNPVALAGRSRATIELELEHSATVTAAVYDMVGRRVGIVTDGYLEAGRHELSWSPAGLTPGLYHCRAIVHFHNQRTTRSVVRTRMITVL